MRKEMYFRLHLTENEHDVVQKAIQDFCSRNNLNLVYYRKIKTGHIPMIREIKVVSNDDSLGSFKKFLKEKALVPYDYI